VARSRSSPTQAAAAATTATTPALTTEDVCMAAEVAVTPNARPVHS
jgi:hypothetical protein